jgi:hypothetical protein
MKGRQERYWVTELKKLGLSPNVERLETIDAPYDETHRIVLRRERYWIDELVCAGAPLINVLGITRIYPQKRLENREHMRQITLKSRADPTHLPFTG